MSPGEFKREFRAIMRDLEMRARAQHYELLASRDPKQTRSLGYTVVREHVRRLPKRTPVR